MRRLQFVAFAAGAPQVIAQAPTLAAGQIGPTRCVPSACPLTLEKVRGRLVVHRADGETFGFGNAGGGIVLAVSGVPAASHEARVGRGIVAAGITIASIGLAAGLYRGLTALTGPTARPRRIGSGLAIAGVGVLTGGLAGAHADAYFRRSVDVYNASLPK